MYFFFCHCSIKIIYTALHTTAGQKRIIDKERSYYSIALSPYREDPTEICRLFSDGRLEISKVASNFFERGIDVNSITLTDTGRDSEQGLTYFNVERTEKVSDIFRFIKENEISILYEIIHNI